MSLPIDEVLPRVLASLARHPRLLLEAAPGAGKTTRVPPAMLDAAWLAGRKIMMLEPRRIAARAAAQFMAAQRGEAVGETVGYRIRFESRVGPRTRIEVVTEGILTRMIQSDPELPGIGAIVFDEFHERHLAGDLGAALALDVQAALRPDLRLLIMSATLDGERIAHWFDAPRLSSAGRSFPVRIVHAPAKPREATTQHLRRIVDCALRETQGDILVFLPGRREIDQALRVLRGAAQHPAGGAVRAVDPPSGDDVQVLPLHGELALAEQHAALMPGAPGTRRIVLATNVAESSLTLPGIGAVIDSGLAREPRLDANSGFSRLCTVQVSQASAEQRAGRAGRLAEGVAYRMWPQSLRLEPSRRAEIAQVELSALALELAAWGTQSLRWLDAPPAGALAGARDLLVLLGALELSAPGKPTAAPEARGGIPARITALGQRMLDSGTAPRLAAIVEAAAPARKALACDVIALLEARNPLRGDAGRDAAFQPRLDALIAWRRRGRNAHARGAADVALADIDRAAAAWRRRFGVRDDMPCACDALDAGNLLLHGFPDRVARQDAGNPQRYALANGRGAQLPDDARLRGEAWLVVPDLRFDERDSTVRCAAPFDAALLERDFPDLLTRLRTARWNRERRAVEAFEERRFCQLVLERRAVPPLPQDALPALLAALRELGVAALPWSDAARSLRLRVACLREWCPELELPDLSDAALEQSLDAWLAPSLAGITRLDALTPAMLGDALALLLDHRQRGKVDALAPEALPVPSGNSRRLHYEPGTAPVLAVKLQELFGLADTPRIAHGRVAVTLHLLSPAQRPIQVTQDLRGFWDRTYPQVKKELKGRYPRHPWPDDPWNAVPTARARPRQAH